MGIPNNICRAMAPPNISASDVETEASTALPKMGRDSQRGAYFSAASLKHSPVTMPKCATLCWSTISITVERVTTHNRVYPNSDPAAKLEAQLPGSIKPTVTNKPGPIYLKKSNPPKYRWWSFRFNSLSNFFSISNVYFCFYYRLHRLFILIRLQKQNPASVGSHPSSVSASGARGNAHPVAPIRG